MTEHVGQFVVITERMTGRRLTAGMLERFETSGRLWVAGHIDNDNACRNLTVVVDPRLHAVEVAE